MLKEPVLWGGGGVVNGQKMIIANEDEMKEQGHSLTFSPNHSLIVSLRREANHTV